jgi:SAM-dependent methyltransferase
MRDTEHEEDLAMPTTTLDFATITERQRGVWSAGDYGVIALSLMSASEALVQAVDPHAGERVLDVACGSGNTALVAARRYCEVSGIDYVPALLERAARRAAAEGVQLDLHAGDAQAMPFESARFDVVLSSFGVMFAPDQEAAAAEMLRVCRPGGRLGLASWTPEGEVGHFFEIVGRYAPPPSGLEAPTRWGSEEGVRQLLGSGVRSLKLERRAAREHFRSAEHALDVFRNYFGPTRTTFDALDAEGQRALSADLLGFFRECNRATDGTAVISLEYREVVATRS